MKTALHYMTPLALVIALGIMAQAPASPPPALKEYTKFSQRTAQVQQAVATTVIAQNALDAADASSVFISAKITTISYEYPNANSDTGPGDPVKTLFDVNMKDICSGIIIKSNGSESVIATAGHCMTPDYQTFFGVPIAEMDFEPVQVTAFDGNVGKVTSYWHDNVADVGFIKVKFTKHETAVVMTPNRHRAEPVFLVGMAFGDYWAVETATLKRDAPAISAVKGDLGWPGALVFGCTGCGPGDSGAGFFDSEGRLMAVLVGVLVSNPSTTYGYPIESILASYGKSGF